MRRAAKVDDTQGDIVDALRKGGASVQILSAVGKGCPDLLVGAAFRNWLVEVKSEGGELTDDQVTFVTEWRGQPVAIIRSAEEAIAWLNSVRCGDANGRNG